MDDVKLYRGKGCEKCNSTGFWGRVAIFEILPVDEYIRELIMKRVPASDICRYAISQGMRTLRQSGWQKVIAGYTTPEEIIEVAPDEIMNEEEKTATHPLEAAPPMLKSESSEGSASEKKESRWEEKRAFKSDSP